MVPHSSALSPRSLTVAVPKGTVSPGHGVLLRFARSLEGIACVAPLRERLGLLYLGPGPPEPVGGDPPEPVPMNASTAPTAAAITATVATALFPFENRR